MNETAIELTEQTLAPLLYYCNFHRDGLPQWTTLKWATAKNNIPNSRKT